MIDDGYVLKHLVAAAADKASLDGDDDLTLAVGLAVALPVGVSLWGNCM